MHKGHQNQNAPSGSYIRRLRATMIYHRLSARCTFYAAHPWPEGTNTSFAPLHTSSSSNMFFLSPHSGCMLKTVHHSTFCNELTSFLIWILFLRSFSMFSFSACFLRCCFRFRNPVTNSLHMATGVVNQVLKIPNSVCRLGLRK